MVKFNFELPGRVTVLVEFHHYILGDQGDAGVAEALTRIAASQDAVEKALTQLIVQNEQREEKMTVRLDALAQAVQRNSDAEDSASTLLASLAEEIRSLEPTQQ